MNRIRSLALAVCLSASMVGCAGAIPAIAVITSIASEAVEWVNIIADFLAPAPLDESTRAKVDIAIEKARLAALALQAAGRGADRLSREELDRAFADFRAAYEALLELAEPLGVRKALPDGALGVARHSSGRDVLSVPRPEDFAL